MSNNDSAAVPISLSVFATFVVLGLIGAGMYGCPQYNIYEQRASGEAELAKSEYSRQVQVRDAQGRLDSASLLAQVEVKRAEGVAKANQIIGDSLKGNDAYLRYLWITDVTAGKSPTVIYVPTEAGLPILEANRMKETQK